MFELTLNYFGFLKHIPLLPQLFDGFMKIEKFFTNKNILDYIDEIENEILTWENSSTRIHRFGGIQFDIGKKEIGHIHSNGLMDILFSKAIKERLIQEGKVTEHHTFKNSGWISFYIKTKEDKELALQLLKFSYSLKL